MASGPRSPALGGKLFSSVFGGLRLCLPPLYAGRRRGEPGRATAASARGYPTKRQRITSSVFILAGAHGRLVCASFPRRRSGRAQWRVAPCSTGRPVRWSMAGLCGWSKRRRTSVTAWRLRQQNVASSSEKRGWVASIIVSSWGTTCELSLPPIPECYQTLPILPRGALRIPPDRPPRAFLSATCFCRTTCDPSLRGSSRRRPRCAPLVASPGPSGRRRVSPGPCAPPKCGPVRFRSSRR